MKEIKITSTEYQALLTIINDRYGYDFFDYSESSFYRRLIRFMTNERIEEINDLGQKLYFDKMYFAHFLENITVNVTEMFRDPTFYESLGKNIFPELNTYPFIKICCVA